MKSLSDRFLPQKPRASYRRRSFLARSFLTGLGVSFATNAKADGIEEKISDATPSNPRELLYPTPEPSKKIFTKESGSFAASFPMLQNVGENGATVVWALNVPSTGWVEWGLTPALGKVARNSEFGLNPFEENFISARIEGLTPNTTYYYRVATCAFSYRTAYDKTIADPQYSDVYSFKTTGANAEKVSFAVMNDTHNQIETLRAFFNRFDELNPDLIVWNGDVCHRYISPLIAKTAIANPCDVPYASSRPLLFVCGNHEKRGPYAHLLKECFTPWRQKDPRFRSLGWNAAFRLGSLAIVSFDTGEAGGDDFKVGQGITDFDAYWRLQAEWLEETLKRPEIASAPFLLAFCHIPLANDAPVPNVKPTKPLEWGAYHPLCAKHIGPILDRNDVSVVISAHLHQFGFTPASKERPWAQLRGGGPKLDKATCIRAEATKERLTITVEKLEDRSVLGTWDFEPRGN